MSYPEDLNDSDREISNALAMPGDASTYSEDELRALDHILTHAPTPEERARLEKFLGKNEYTSHLIRTLAAIYYHEYDDARGATLLRHFADRFAEHEARTV